MCESMFKLRLTIDHTGHMCNTLNPKLLSKYTNSDNLTTIVNELFQVSIDRRFKYCIKGNRQESIHRHHKVIFNECRAQEVKERQT